MKRVAILVCLISAASGAWAQLPAGNWVKRPSSSPSPPMMMTIEPAGPGIKITYRMLDPKGAPINQGIMTVVTAFDGKDAPTLVDGKESGQTMAIRRLDAVHTATEIKMLGKEIGKSQSELSPDGKTLKVENDMSALNPSVGKQIEYWDRR
jgi:hypothetical protein